MTDYCKTCFHEKQAHIFHNGATAPCAMDCGCEDFLYGETRTTSSTGAEKGTKDARYDLIPVPALDYLARLYGIGARKYAEHNWRLGYDWSKSYAAAQRHMNAFWQGEDIDPETQVPHVINAAFHMFALATYLTEHPEFDDRFETRPDVQPTLQEVMGKALDQMAQQMGAPVSIPVPTEAIGKEVNVIHILKTGKKPITRAAKKLSKAPENAHVLFHTDFTDEDISKIFDKAAKIQKEASQDG